MKPKLDMDWVDLSRIVTTLNKPVLIRLLHDEAAGQKRVYIMRRLHGVIRKHQLQEDIAVLRQGKIPAWIKP